jgi:LAS superfamily LD-carboxypeptidase LdcB
VRLLVLVLWFGLVGVAHAEKPRVERGYRNGKPVRIRVVQIGWAEVEVATARAFKKMALAARKDGIDLSIRSGFRSHQRQKELYRAWREGWGNKAARPGFSNHQSGSALDIDLDNSTLAWLSRNAKRFGFKQTVRGEPWHWEFGGVGRRATARASSRRHRS